MKLAEGWQLTKTQRPSEYRLQYATTTFGVIYKEHGWRACYRTEQTIRTSPRLATRTDATAWLLKETGHDHALIIQRPPDRVRHDRGILTSEPDGSELDEPNDGKYCGCEPIFDGIHDHHREYCDYYDPNTRTIVDVAPGIDGYQAGTNRDTR